MLFMVWSGVGVFDVGVREARRCALFDAVESVLSLVSVMIEPHSV